MSLNVFASKNFSIILVLGRKKPILAKKLVKVAITRQGLKIAIIISSNSQNHHFAGFSGFKELK